MNDIYVRKNNSFKFRNHQNISKYKFTESVVILRIMIKPELINITDIMWSFQIIV